MRLSTKLIAALVVLVFFATVLADRLASRDAVLSGARDFVANAPEVIAVVGPVDSTRPQRLSAAVAPHTSASAPATPAQQRDYQVGVDGTRGSAQVNVRAQRSDPTAPWQYQVLSVK